MKHKPIAKRVRRAIDNANEHLGHILNGWLFWVFIAALFAFDLFILVSILTTQRP